MAIIIKNNIQQAKKTKKCACKLHSVVTGHVNGELNYVGKHYNCDCKQEKSLINAKDASFGVIIDSYSESKLNKVLATAKKAGLKVEKFTNVDLNDVLIFGKSTKYDLVVVNAVTDYLLGTEPLYSLKSHFNTVLDAIEQYANTKGIKSTKTKKLNKNKVSFDDIIITDDWIFADGQLIDNNSAADTYISTSTKEVIVPGILSEIILD